MVKIKSSNIKEQTVEDSIFFFVGYTEVNPFCLITTDYKVIEAYKKLLNNHNSDISH